MRTHVSVLIRCDWFCVFQLHASSPIAETLQRLAACMPISKFAGSLRQEFQGLCETAPRTNVTECPQADVDVGIWTRCSKSQRYQDDSCCETHLAEQVLLYCVETLVKGGLAMANHAPKKCAHIPCTCEVTNGDEFCGQACRDAGSEEVEIACNCSHTACPLTV